MAVEKKEETIEEKIGGAEAMSVEVSSLESQIEVLEISSEESQPILKNEDVQKEDKKELPETKFTETVDEKDETTKEKEIEAQFKLEEVSSQGDQKDSWEILGEESKPMEKKEQGDALKTKATEVSENNGEVVCMVVEEASKEKLGKSEIMAREVCSQESQLEVQEILSEERPPTLQHKEVQKDDKNELPETKPTVVDNKDETAEEKDK